MGCETWIIDLNLMAADHNHVMTVVKSRITKKVPGSDSN